MNPSSARPPFWSWACLGLAVILFLGLALSGIRYGLPNSRHILSYNTDETTWLDALGRLKEQANPHPRLVTPTLYLGMYGLFLLALDQLHLVSLRQNKEWFRAHPEEFARLYLAGRVLQVILGVLLLLSFWGLATFLFGPRTGGLGVLLLAVTPSLVAASHFSQANVPVALLAFFSVACLLVDESQGRSKKRWLFLSALLAGLSVSTKYSAVPLVFPLLGAVFRHDTERGKKGLGVAVLGPLGFLIGTPFALLAPHSFWEAFQTISRANVEPVHGLIEKIIFPLQHAFRYALGLPLEIASFAAAAWFGWKRDRYTNIILWWLVPFVLSVVNVGYIATSGRVLVTVPWLVLATVLLLDRALGARRGGRVWAGVVFGLVFAGTLMPSLAIARLHRRPALQTVMSEWMEAALPKGSLIGIPSDAYWWTPDIAHESFYHPERLAAPFRVINVSFSKERALEVRPDFLLISQTEIQRCEAWTYDDVSPEGCREFIGWLKEGTGYRLLKAFPREVGWGTWRWHRPELPFMSDDDLWATSLFLYARRPAAGDAPALPGGDVRGQPPAR